MKGTESRTDKRGGLGYKVRQSVVSDLSASSSIVLQGGSRLSFPE